MNRILVVDDEGTNLEVIRRLLRRDYMLKYAQSGEEALGLIPDFCPDLILLDIMMPGIDGYEVCRRVKSDSKTSGIMVLLVSARSALEDRLKGYEVGADDYTSRPYASEELRAKIRILLRLKNAQDELRTLNQDLEKLVEIETRELVRKERQAIIGQMVQGIVHNLRGPATVVQGWADIAHKTARNLLENSKDDPDNVKKTAGKVIQYLERLSEAVDKIDLLIDSLLAKGRQEAVQERQPLNLNDIIVQEIEFLDADMDIKHGVKKYLYLDSSIPDLYGTYSDFSQITYNLVKNASEAMKRSEKKELHISTSHDEENIYIVFQDTGSGISPDDLGLIFNPFFTTKRGRQSDEAGEPTGTGLGLYTCSQLMRYYGGEISVQSKLGAGTTFTIAIPQKRPLPHG
jgi:signal transduction histidine kinase